MSHRLIEGASRLRESGVLALTVGTPETDGWFSLDRAVQSAATWHVSLARQHGDQRAAAAFLATWLASPPALVIGLPAVLTGAASKPRVEEIWLDRHPDGWFQRYAVAPSRDDETEDDEVLASAGTWIAEVTAPLVDRLCDRLPIGRPALWGGTTDALGAYVLWFARETGADGQHLWARASALLDHLTHASGVRYRPRLFPVACNGETRHFHVRSTCCLYYRTQPADAGAEAYCTTCPLRSDDERTARIEARLDRS